MKFSAAPVSNATDYAIRPIGNPRASQYADVSYYLTPPVAPGDHNDAICRNDRPLSHFDISSGRRSTADHRINRESADLLCCNAVVDKPFDIQGSGTLGSLHDRASADLPKGF